MVNILVTGGTGFVGHWLCQTQHEFLPDSIGFYLSRADYESGLWMDAEYDYIIHAANISPSMVIEHAKHNKNTRLLYISSGAAYDQNTEYAENKRRWEKECLDSGVDVVIARLFAFYGAWLDDNKAITQFIRNARKGEPLKIWGDGNTVRSYMSGRTMARWLWAILLRGQAGEVYDVGSDEPVTMLELARMVVKYYRPAPILIQGGVDAMPVYLPRDTAKTKALLK